MKKFFTKIVESVKKDWLLWLGYMVFASTLVHHSIYGNIVDIMDAITKLGLWVCLHIMVRSVREKDTLLAEITQRWLETQDALADSATEIADLSAKYSTLLHDFKKAQVRIFKMKKAEKQCQEYKHSKK
jgi:hypothetical protein